MTFNVYKLFFTSSLHLSRGKMASYESSDKILHSDTLKSALFANALQFGEAFAMDLWDKVTLSSAFPFDSSGYWLPRPVGFSFSDETADNRKEQKKNSHFSVNQYEKLLKGEQNSQKLGADYRKMPKIWERDTTQRVWITDNPEQSTPFYLEKLYPIAGNALYFIAYSEDPNFDFKKIESVLRLLGDNGIGLQRNLGNGLFNFEADTLTLDLPQNAETWVNLSLYRPENLAEVDDALQKEHTNYQFVKRGGWLSSPANTEHISIRKQAAMFFTEGSVFEFGLQQQLVFPKGASKVDLTPEDLPPTKPQLEHRIWRDGRALFLPYHLNVKKI